MTVIHAPRSPKLHMHIELSGVLANLTPLYHLVPVLILQGLCSFYIYLELLTVTASCFPRLAYILIQEANVVLA